MKKRISTCSDKEGITYSFDNSQIIDYQDNYNSWATYPFLYISILKQLHGTLFFLLKNDSVF